MNHHDQDDHDLERLISRSLAARSETTDGVGGSLDDVHRRVDLRRGRRRHVAAFGATATLAVGAFALTAIGSSDSATVPLATPGSGSVSQPVDQAAWRCTGQVAPMDDQGASYFAHCEQITIEGTVPASTMPIIPTTTTIVCSVPATDTAMTTVPCTWGEAPTVGVDCSTMSRPADVTVPCTTAPVQEVTHRVEAGETLTSISEAYGIPIEEIVALNQWDGRSDVTLIADDTIVIALTPIRPTPTVPSDLVSTTTSIPGRVQVEQEYIIRAGDSLASIAAAFGVTLEQVVNYNEFDDGVEHLLLPDERLLIPPDALAQP